MIRSLTLLALTAILLAFTSPAGTPTYTYEIKRVYPSLSLTSSALASAKTIPDLNDRFAADWIKRYDQVSIAVQVAGKQVVAVGSSEQLTTEQQQVLAKADPNSEVRVTIDYLPNNTLKQNTPKTMDFRIAVDPERDASFVGGTTALNAYLQSAGLDRLPQNAFRQYQLAAVTFTVDHTGQVAEATLAEKSEAPEVDEQVLNAICNMPAWQPARYANGALAEQTFVLLIGDQSSCVRNFFNLRELGLTD